MHRPPLPRPQWRARARRAGCRRSWTLEYRLPRHRTARNWTPRNRPLPNRLPWRDCCRALWCGIDRTRSGLRCDHSSWWHGGRARRRCNRRLRKRRCRPLRDGRRRLRRCCRCFNARNGCCYWRRCRWRGRPYRRRRHGNWSRLHRRNRRRRPLRDRCDRFRRLRPCYFRRGSLLDRLQHVAGLGNFREINFGFELFRSRFRARLLSRATLALAEVLAHFFRGFGINGARMALFLRDPDARQQVENRLALDLELSRQIVDADFIHELCSNPYSSFVSSSVCCSVPSEASSAGDSKLGSARCGSPPSPACIVSSA